MIFKKKIDELELALLCKVKKMVYNGAKLTTMGGSWFDTLILKDDSLTITFQRKGSDYNVDSFDIGDTDYRPIKNRGVRKEITQLFKDVVRPVKAIESNNKKIKELEKQNKLFELLK